MTGIKGQPGSRIRCIERAKQKGFYDEMYCVNDFIDLKGDLDASME